MLYFPLNSPFIFSNGYEKPDYLENADNTTFSQRAEALLYPKRCDVIAIKAKQVLTFQFSADKSEVVKAKLNADGLIIPIDLKKEERYSIDVYTGSITLPEIIVVAQIIVCNDNADVFCSQQLKVLEANTSGYYRVTSSDVAYKNGTLFGGKNPISYDFLLKMQPPELSMKTLLDVFEDEVGGVTPIKRQVQREMRYVVLECMDVFADRLRILLLNKNISINGVVGNISTMEFSDLTIGVKKIVFSLQINNDFQIISGQTAPPVTVLGANATNALSDKNNTLLMI